MSERLELADKLYSYISPEIINAGNDPEFVKKSFAISRAVLQVFHPDRFQDDPVNQDILEEVNRLDKVLSNDNELSNFVFDESKKICDEELYRLKFFETANILFKKVTDLQLKESLSSNSTTKDGFLMPAGEIKFGDNDSLAFVVGERVLKLIQELSTEDLKFVGSQIRRKIVMDSTVSIPGFSRSDWGQISEQLMDGTKTSFDSIPQEAKPAIINKKNEEIKGKIDNMMDILSSDKFEFPKNWWRSFNGEIIIPTIDYGGWGDNYDSLYAKEQEWTQAEVLRKLSIKEGAVIQDKLLDITKREDIQLVDKLPKAKKEAMQRLINNYLNTVKLNNFVYESRMSDKDNSSADFIFEVEKGVAKVLYAIYNIANHRMLQPINEPIGISFDDGIYMIKAGKPKGSKKYDEDNLPLALIKLDVVDTQDSMKGAKLLTCHDINRRDKEDENPSYVTRHLIQSKQVKDWWLYRIDEETKDAHYQAKDSHILEQTDREVDIFTSAVFIWKNNTLIDLRDLPTHHIQTIKS